MSKNLKLMFLTNNPKIGKIIEKCGVDWIFLDLEYRGKKNRQPFKNTVISSHSIEDIRNMRKVISRSKLLVRINPIGNWTNKEIELVINAGADMIMLPYFKTSIEVKKFLEIIDGRVGAFLLLETLEAINSIEKILVIKGIDFIHIGLRDIHIQRRSNFLFEFLSDGLLEELTKKISKFNVDFGFGGIAKIGELKPTAESILAEHIRIGSKAVILSRSFFDIKNFVNKKIFEDQFYYEIQKFRREERKIRSWKPNDFENNRVLVFKDIKKIASDLKNKQNNLL